MQILVGVQARDGRLPEPLRAGIVPPTDEELAAWAELVPGEQMLAEAGARPVDPRAAEEFYLRTTAEPSLEVNGILGGSPTLQKTVLPVQAEANLSIRLAPGQDVETDRRPRSSSCCATRPRRAPSSRSSGSRRRRPALVPPDAPAVQLAQDAFEQTMGRRPLLVRSGGTLPIVPALVDKGIPTIVTGFAHAREQHPLAERAAARGVHAARDRDGEGALPAAGGARPLGRPARSRASRARSGASRR